MLKRIVSFGMTSFMFLCIMCCGKKGAHEPSTEEIPKPVSIEQLTTNPSIHVNSFVIFSGLLVNQGTDYFKDLRPVIQDTLGNGVPVTIWVPIEIPPMQDPSMPRPKALHDYMDKKVKLKGYLRSGKLGPSKDYEYYFEVKEAEIVYEE